MRPESYSRYQPMNRIRVIYEQDEDAWTATSPEVPGWTAVGETYEEAHRLAEEGVRFALDREDVEIRHFVPAPA
jgi:predicted RNase H-like HicB family nuclease